MHKTLSILNKTVLILGFQIRIMGKDPEIKITSSIGIGKIGTWSLEHIGSMILIVLVVVLLSYFAVKNVTGTDLISYLFSAFLEAGSGGQTTELSELEQAIRCSYYRCTRGCQALKDMDFGDFDCLSFCNENWVEGTKETICGWAAQQAPVEFSGGGTISAENLKEVAQCVYDSASKCLLYVPVNSRFVFIDADVSNREATGTCAGTNPGSGTIPGTPKFASTISSGSISQAIYIYTSTGQQVCSGWSNTLTSVETEPSYITLVPDEEKSVTIVYSSIGISSRPYRVVVEGVGELIIETKATVVGGSTPVPLIYDKMYVTCMDGTEESGLGEGECLTGTSKTFCSGHLLAKCVNAATDYKLTYISEPEAEQGGGVTTGTTSGSGTGTTQASGTCQFTNCNDCASNGCQWCERWFGPISFSGCKSACDPAWPFGNCAWPGTCVLDSGKCFAGGRTPTYLP